MTQPGEDEPTTYITTNESEVRAIVEGMYINGFMDDCAIYEIITAEGERTTFMAGGALKKCADQMIELTWPGCTAILLDAGE